MIDSTVVPMFFKEADIETQAAHLARALVSSNCNPPTGPKRGTFGYEYLHTARFFLEQHS